MRAAVLHGREDVRVEEVELPRPGPGEVLLRTRTALTCGTDVKVWRRGYHARMIRPPALFGHELAGSIEEVGPGVERFRPGDRVVPANSAPCGACGFCRSGRASLCDDLLFWNGAYAEFARVPARVVDRNLLLLEPRVSFRDAALTEPLACAVRGIEALGRVEGRTVAVIGAGPIGLMLARLAVLAGARVVVVGRNRARLQRALGLGAAEAVSVDDGDQLRRRLAACGADEQAPDVVVEAAGTPETAEAALQSVRKGGLVNLFAGMPAGTRVALDVERLHYEEITVTSSFHHTPESFRAALALITSGRIEPGSFITADAPLAELPDVLRRAAGGDHGLKTAILPWD
jgi:L-iditol 2-dehydrogenase